MSTMITYHIGGFIPGAPVGNIAERVVDNGDGTGTRTTYDTDGTAMASEQLTGLPMPVAPEPDPIEVLTAQVAELQVTVDALQAGGA